MKIRKWIVVILLFMSNLYTKEANAYTSFPITLKCPIDGDTFTTYVTGSYSTFGSFKDFQKDGAIGNLYSNMIHACPSCKYAGYQDYFATTFSDGVKKEIVNILAHYHDQPLNEILEIEIAV